MLIAAALVWLAGGGACGGHPEGPETDEPAPDISEPVALNVNNNYRLDVVVFVYHDGELTRVGMATAATSTSFSLAPWMLGPSRSIRLVADPIGSKESTRTELLYIQPGQYIDWRLESQLNRSSVSVY